MGQINWTAEAENWLISIYDYIAENNPEAAFSTIQAIYNKVQTLTTFPEMGHRYQHHEKRHIRILLYGHYRIAYLIRPDHNIDILGVFHSAMDIDRYLP
jgi:plasmid stabilization system protein ParE